MNLETEVGGKCTENEIEYFLKFLFEGFLLVVLNQGKRLPLVLFENV